MDTIHRAILLTAVTIVLLLAVVGCTALPASPSWTPIPTLAPTPRTRLILATSMPTASPTPAEPLTFPGYVGGALLIALDAAHNGDWEHVTEELEEAVELTPDLRQRAALNAMLTALADGQTDAVLVQLEQDAAQASADSLLLSELETGLRFARLNDWSEVEEEVNEALDLTTDARLQEAIHEMLSDLAAGRHSEVTRDLERLTRGVGDQDPSLPTLRAAQQHAHSAEWDAMRQHLREALDMTQDPQHQAVIIEILDDLDKGNDEEAVDDLDVLVGQHDAMDPAQAELETALRYATRGEWNKTADDLQEALELSRGAAQQATIRDLLDRLARDEKESVRQGLEQLLAR